MMMMMIDGQEVPREPRTCTQSILSPISSHYTAVSAYLNLSTLVWDNLTHLIAI